MTQLAHDTNGSNDTVSNGVRLGKLKKEADKSMPYVAVIGAGAAGLAAGRLLIEAGVRVKIFDRLPGVGGVWRYNRDPKHCTPIYRSLVINIPKETLAYLDYPVPDEHLSFTTHSQVLDYLNNYAKDYGIIPYIKFNSHVVSLRLAVDSPGEVEEGPLSKWEVAYRDGEEAGEETPSLCTKTETFDAVCVASGHYDQAFTPQAAGFEGFRGYSMHARAYDRPDTDAFDGKRVLCVGASYSGSDIAREISSTAAVIHVSDRQATAVTKGGERGNIWWRPGITSFEGENKVRFNDGMVEEVDTVVWCTGYEYSYPFLEGTGLLTPPVKNRVHPLYEEIFHNRYPSLSFIGLPHSVAPFPLAEVQSNYLAAVVTGRVSIPSRADRERWLVEAETEAFEQRGVDPASRKAHFMHHRQWPYLKGLLSKAGGPGTLMSRTNKVKDRPGWWTVKSLRNSKAVEYIGGGEAEAVKEGDLCFAATKPDFRGPLNEEQQRKDMRTIVEMLELREVVYDDAAREWSQFPGGDDDYRRRMYELDWLAGNYKVYLSSLKANGEGPYIPCVAEADRA